MLKDYRTHGYEAPELGSIAIGSENLCETSASGFIDGGIIPGWDEINTSLLEDGGSLPNFD